MCEYVYMRVYVCLRKRRGGCMREFDKRKVSVQETGTRASVCVGVFVCLCVHVCVCVCV